MTELEKLKQEYPNLDYENSAFYEDKDHDDYLLVDYAEQIDADYLIRNHYCIKLNKDVDSNYIKDYLGGYQEAFLNT